MTDRFVIDTCAILSYYSKELNCNCSISDRSCDIMARGFARSSDVNLVIPTTVFIELYEKWCKSESIAEFIYRGIFLASRDQPNIEIRALDMEVVQCYAGLNTGVINLECHDKIMLSSAVTLDCPIITNDPKIIAVAQNHYSITVLA